MPDTVADPGPAIDLAAGAAAVALYPDAGGRIGQITVSGQPLLVDVPGADAHPMGWGSYPMAPWAGRIRQGRFAFDGGEYQLAINHEDGEGGPRRRHSIHGTVFDRPWTVDRRSSTSVTLSSPLGGRLRWPFGGTARQHVELTPDHVRCELRVEADGASFPAEIGWHPWFRKPDRLTFAPGGMYRRDADGLPTGELTEPSAGPWDDCFVNSAPVVLHYERATAPTITVTSDCDHWVVFDEPADATCVEPQSGPPDAVNLGVRHVVTATGPLQRTMTISW